MFNVNKNCFIHLWYSRVAIYVRVAKICLSLNITSRGHDIISRPQKWIWPYRKLISLATAYHHVPMASYVLATKSYVNRGRPLKKINVLTQPVFTVYPIMQNKSSSCTALRVSHNNVSYSLDVALACISYKTHHCSSQFDDTDVIPYIVITEESNINVCFILYTSPIRKTFYKLLL